MRCDRSDAGLPERRTFARECRTRAVQLGRCESPFAIFVSIFAAALVIAGGLVLASEQDAGELRYCTPPGQFGKTCVEVSSRLPNTKGIEYGPRNLVDHNPATAWVADAGHGGGQWVLLTFDYPMKFSRIFIRSGYCKSEHLLLKNNAPRTVAIVTEAGERRVDLTRTVKEQTIRLPAPVISRWVKLEIRSVYPGSKYSATAISEIMVDLEEFNYEPTGNASTTSPNGEYP